jgi:hypothetical protein
MSDEPTLYAYTLAAGADPTPDAVVQRNASGAITGIQRRAQRSQSSPADGRIYRIRLTATDSCGLQSFADCFVTVPTHEPRARLGREQRPGLRRHRDQLARVAPPHVSRNVCRRAARACRPQAASSCL